MSDVKPSGSAVSSAADSAAHTIMDLGSSWGDIQKKLKSIKAEDMSQLDSMSLQLAMNQQSMITSTLTNLMKSFFDTTRAIISNIRP